MNAKFVLRVPVGIMDRLQSAMQRTSQKNRYPVECTWQPPISSPVARNHLQPLTCNIQIAHGMNSHITIRAANYPVRM